MTMDSYHRCISQGIRHAVDLFTHPGPLKVYPQRWWLDGRYERECAAYDREQKIKRHDANLGITVDSQGEIIYWHMNVMCWETADGSMIVEIPRNRFVKKEPAWITRTG